jgi:hypothetical protein
MFFGLVLIVVGIFALLVNLGVLSGSLWSYVWPIILVILGIGLFFRKTFWWGWRRHHWRYDEEEEKPKRR